MGLEPTNLLTASQALYQLSYAPVAFGQHEACPIHPGETLCLPGMERIGYHRVRGPQGSAPSSGICELQIRTSCPHAGARLRLPLAAHLHWWPPRSL